MSKILYVNENLHHKLKVMSTHLHLSMQQAAEEAVTKWLADKETEQAKLAQAFNAIKGKLNSDEQKVIESLLISNNNMMSTIKTELNIEEKKVLEALLAQKKSE